MACIYHLWNIWFHEAQFNVFWLVTWNWIANPNTLLILGGPAIPLFLCLVDFIYQIILSSVQALLLLIVVVVNDIVLTPTYTWTKGCFDKDKALNFEAYYDPECGITTSMNNSSQQLANAWHYLEHTFCRYCPFSPIQSVSLFF